MDSALDIKFKQLMSEYYPKKEEYYNPFYFSKYKPFLGVKTKLKKKKSQTIFPNNINNKQKNDSSNNIIFIKLKSPEQRDNKPKIKLKSYKQLPLSITTSDKNTNCRLNNKHKKLVTSDILQDKAFSILGKGQLRIHSLINQIKENKDKNKKNYYIKKNLSEFELNKLHNLQLTPLKEKKISRRMTKFAMLNNLYHKYSSTLSGSFNNKNDNNNIESYYKKSKNNKEFEKNNHIYLTYYDKNKGFNFNNIYKRNLNLPDNQNNNNKIINKDRKICIDCLFSRVDSDINSKKIFPKDKGKTIYNLQKENSYIRIQNLDNIFTQILKK